MGRWVGGGTPSKANPHYWTDGTIPWVSAKDMKTAVIRETIDKITDDAVRNSATKKVPAGSVLCVMRSGILAHTFPVALNEMEVTINQDLRALVPREGVSGAYLAHFLRFSSSQILRSCSKHGTTVASIEAPQLNRVLVPLPDIDTQRSIVRRIEELFTDIDDGEEELLRARQELEIYRKSLLKAAVTGELTPDWRAKHGDRNETAASSMAGWPLLPVGWCYRPLETLLSSEPGSLTDGPFGSKLKSEHYRSSGPRVIRLQNIGKHGHFIDEKAHISPEHFSSLARHHVMPGDLVIAILGDISPRAALVPNDIGAALVKADCFKVRFGEDVDCTFAWAWFNSGIVQSRLSEAIKGVGRPRIGMKDIRYLPVPVPPFAEQLVIAERLTTALAEKSETERVLGEIELQSRDQRLSILAAAFRGELVQ